MTADNALQNKVQDLSNLLEAFRQLNSNLNLKDVFQNILLQTALVVKAEAGTLWVVDKEKNSIIASAVYGPVSSEILNVKMSIDEGIVGQVIQTGTAELIEDVTKHPNWAQRVDDSSQFITKSMITVPLIANNQILGALQLLNKKDVAFFNDEDIDLSITLANQSALALHNSQLYEEVQQMFLSMIKTLVKTLDARDPYTAGHSERVAKYSVWIGNQLNLGEQLTNELYKAALLHDIGKMGVPDEVLLKHGRLTDEEFTIIKQHTVIGSTILGNMEPKDSMVFAIQTARSHHEKMNGTGYPDQLQGTDIPFFARIVGVADAFDAMTTVRPYSKGMPPEQAAEELIRCKDTIFDAEVVDAFIAVLKVAQYDVDHYEPVTTHKVFL